MELALHKHEQRSFQTFQTTTSKTSGINQSRYLREGRLTMASTDAHSNVEKIYLLQLSAAETLTQKYGVAAGLAVPRGLCDRERGLQGHGPDRRVAPRRREVVPWRNKSRQGSGQGGSQGHVPPIVTGSGGRFDVTPAADVRSG